MRLFFIIGLLVIHSCDHAEQMRLTKEQNEILTIYCKAYEPCKKEMRKWKNK